MKRFQMLIKPASSLCNMRCRYCFYHAVSSAREKPSYGIMAPETRDAIIGNVFKDIEDGCEFFRERNFLLGLSLDPSRRFHDRNRLSAAGEGTFDACMRGKELLDTHGVEYNILCVLTGGLAKEPEKAWRFLTDNKIRYVQFIPCLEPLPGGGKNVIPENILRPAQFAQFYIRLLRLWSGELEKGSYISVKLFDDTVNYFLKGVPAACGIDGQCRNQYVVEADGGVYPCDFFAFDRYKTGNLVRHTLREIFDSEQSLNFLQEKPELPKLCETCAFRTTCRSGCRSLRLPDISGKEP